MQHNKRKIFSYLFQVFLLVAYVSYGSTTAKAQEHNHQNHAEAAHGTETHAVDAHATEAHGEEKVDAGKLIMEHIADAHDWHIASIGHTHITIPLPIIIKDDSGIKMFLSSRFEHGHAAYEGYKLIENKIVAVNTDGTENHEASFYDISITKNVASMFVSVILLCWIMFSVASSYGKNAGKAPKGLANLIEMAVLFIRDEVAKPSIGPKYNKFLPYLLSIFFFIFL